MDTVTLKTKRNVGSFEFRRETKMVHPVTRKPYSAPVVYRFDFDNSFKTDVPKSVWEEIKNIRVDKNGTTYNDILFAL